MGEEKLASFFHKVQAVEESFLFLEGKERSRALNILQSSINKLLNFVGDTSHIYPGQIETVFSAQTENKNNFSGTSCSKQAEANHWRKQKSCGKKRKGDDQAMKKAAGKKKNCAVYCSDESADRTVSSEDLFGQSTGEGHGRPHRRGDCIHLTDKHKEHNKGNFEADDFQELTAFDCSYDFNPALQHAGNGNVSRPGVRHVAQCSNKLSGKMLSLSAAAANSIVCTSSGAQPPYPGQMVDVVASGERSACDISHSHYQSSMLSGQDASIGNNCHIAHAQQYRAQQIMPGTQIDSSTDNNQYTGGVIDPSTDPSQYAGGVIDSSGDPSQYANSVVDNADPNQYSGGGVIDSTGDPSQYAGGVIDSTGKPSQYSGTVLDGNEEGSQYSGNVIGMSGTQEIQNCNTHFSGAMIPTAQDVTVCTTSQYAGTVLAMSVPETVSYSAAHYSHTIMQGINCASNHPHFAGAILDMSAASSRQCEGSGAMPVPHPSAQYAGTIFEGALIGGPSCSPFQIRRPVFETHEAFHRSQELTQSLMQASILQQQQLYRLQHTQHLLAGRWRVFLCRACGESITHHRSIRAHLATHGISPLSCRFCRQKFINALALMHHLCGGQNWKQAAYISREVFVCHECCKMFTSLLQLKAHFEGEHGVEMPQNIKYICRFCGLQLASKKAIFAHYRHHAGARFVCQTCGAFLNDFVQFANHMYRHERSQKKMTCQQCGEVFYSHTKFQKHIKTHPGHSCYMCQKTFSSAFSLYKHQTKVHNIKVNKKLMRSKSKGGHQCGVCWKRFPRAKDLEKHSLLHSGEKPLHCALCKLSFRTTKALATHRQTLGHLRRTGKSKEHQHLCSECGKAYFRREALERHLKQHENSKQFACQYCSFQCQEKDTLQRHMQRHFATQRNFICELCGAAFHAKKTLEMHHNYKHTSERRFKCCECPMTFKARNALGRHVKTHSRTRDHACWCGAAFNRLYNLRRHMQLVHGSDEALPPLRKVEVLDSDHSMKEAVLTPPAKKMLVKTRKVKANCMRKEQEAAAAAVVVGGIGEDGGDRGGSGEGEVEGVLPQSGSMGSLAAQGMDSYPALQAAAAAGAAGGVGMVGQRLTSLSASQPHLTMEQGYAMASAALHHDVLHHHHHPQRPAGPNAPGADPPATLAHGTFTHLSHPPLDYSQLPALSGLVTYPVSVSSSSSSLPAVTTSVAGSQRQDYYDAGTPGLETGLQQPPSQQQPGSVGDSYTTSPFSFIQNFLLPSVGVANLLDLAHASGAK